MNQIWKSKVASVATALLVSVAASSAMADQVKVLDTNLWGTGSSGGPFEVQNLAGNSFIPEGLGLYGAQADAWATFCIEFNETLSQGTTYDVAINTAAVNGGVAGGNPDPLDAKTAYLYQTFMDGNINAALVALYAGAAVNFDYNNTNGGTDEAGSAMQNAIWVIEQEITDVFAAGTLERQLIDLAAANATTIGNVKILNMTRNGNPHQDVLVIIPPDGNVVPTPAAAWAGLGMLGVLGAVRLRKN